jgi:hypothetical protein
MQAICRVADRLSLPNLKDLQQYYGGRARMPANPHADYWLANMLSSTGHSRACADFLQCDSKFRHELEDNELWMDPSQVCTLVMCRSRVVAGIARMRCSELQPALCSVDSAMLCMTHTRLCDVLWQTPERSAS